MRERQVQLLVSGKRRVTQSQYHQKYDIGGFILQSVKPFWNVSATVQQRGRRKISEVTDGPREDLEAEAGSKCAFLCQFVKNEHTLFSLIKVS